MAKRSTFFSAMTCFFTNNQGVKKPKKRSSSQRSSKYKKRHDVLAIEPVPQIISKPKRHLPINSAKPKPIVETIDLTTDEDNHNAMLPIKIQILDETSNVGPFLIHIKADPQPNTEISFNHFTNQVNSPEKYNIKSEHTTNSRSVIGLKDENIIDDSILIDDMSLEKQIDPLRKDSSLLNQYHNFDNIDLSRSENEKPSRINDHTDEIESKSSIVLRKRKPKTDGNSSKISPREKKAEQCRKDREELLASKVITLKECGTYYCTLCEVSIKNQAAVLIHVKTHKKAKFDYKCSVCDEVFQWKAYLIRHLKEHFNTSDLESSVELEQAKEKSRIKSDPTSISLLNKTTVDDHEAFNNLEKKLKSDNSSHAACIKLIGDINRAELNLACAYCDQCFDSQVSLVEHCRTHMADRPFICNVCGMLFKQNDALVYHTRIHFRMIRKGRRRGPAPFIRYVLRLRSCKDCDRSYVSWPALNQHRVDVHGVTLNSFCCDGCQRGFRTLNKLRAHKRRNVCQKLLLQRVTCPICTNSFCNKYILKEHMLKMHPELSIE